jgi:N-acetylmuramoyl-L-alanine amidase
MALHGALRRLGYDAPAHGVFDAATTRIVAAFQRHWAPARCDGVADGPTRLRLTSVLRLAGAQP